MIKSLPKTFERKGAELPYFYDDLWITNGCFAIARNQIKDSFRYCLSKPNVSQPDINRIVPKSIAEFVPIERTNRLYEMSLGDYARVFVDLNDNEYLINEMYVKHFSLKSLYASPIDYGVIINQSITFIVMPMRNDQKKALKAA